MKSPIVPANIDELYPLATGTEARLGPDGRYKLWFDVGPTIEPVHVSPHTLMYISMVVSGSRLVVDPKKAIEFGEKAVINDSAYRDIYTRLQVLMGQTMINASDLKDLRSLSRDQKEGDGGISERDAANVWLTQAIADAQRPENGNCLTPDLAQKVFLKLLETGAIYYPDLKTRIHWTKISDDLLLKYLVPSLMHDVNTALGSGLGAVNSMYDEIFQEIITLSLDKSATSYQSGTGENRPISKDRLEQIAKLYEIAEHRPFSYQEVTATFALSTTSGERKRHQGLLRAVKTYLASRATDQLTFESIEQYVGSSQASSEIRQKIGDVSHVLEHELGYCGHCMKAALTIARQAKSRVEQVVK
jgi:hypothetical protein